MYLIKELLDESLVAIGRVFGGRDHSTVIHSIRKVEADSRRTRASPSGCGRFGRCSRDEKPPDRLPARRGKPVEKRGGSPHPARDRGKRGGNGAFLHAPSTDSGAASEWCRKGLSDILGPGSSTAPQPLLLLLFLHRRREAGSSSRGEPSRTLHLAECP
jgi:hypothetical protein